MKAWISLYHLQQLLFSLYYYGHTHGYKVISHGTELCFLMTYDVDHSFMFLLTTGMFMEKCLHKSFAHFSNGFSFYCKCPLYEYILDSRYLSDIWFENIFSHFMGFHFFRFLILMSSNVSIVCFISCAFGVITRKSLSTSRHELLLINITFQLGFPLLQRERNKNHSYLFSFKWAWTSIWCGKCGLFL